MKLSCHRRVSWSAGVFALLAAVSASMAAEGVPAELRLKERGFGWVMTDTKGMSLYTTVKDQTPGKSACEGPCAQQWPAVLAAADATANGDWALVTRANGSKQWAFRNQPLYRFARDLSPGDSYGDGVDGEWNIATRYVASPASVAVARTALGHVFVDANTGTALYRFTKDKPNQSACTASCMRDWTPFKAPAMAVPPADWSVLQRGDGIRQWLFKGTPLYRYNGDRESGDTRGHGAQEEKWLAYVLDPLPSLPSWVTVQGSDAGLILADSQNRTLYGRTQSRIRGGAATADIHAAAIRAERPGYEVIGEARTTDCIECARSYWKPVLAKPEDKSSGNWSIVKRDDGKLQWAFKGEPLYTHERDKWRGALNGIRSGDRSWHALMRSGLAMQGTGN